MSVQPPPGQSDTLAETRFRDRASRAAGESPAGRSGYSRFVSSMKIILPALAVFLILTIFISTGTFNSRDELAITFKEVGALNDDLRMVSPRITGVDRRGRPYVVTADTATQAQNQPDLISLENIEADLMLDSGGDWLSVSSRFGILQADMEMLSLSEQVDVFSATGYEFHAETAEIDLKQGTLTSDRPVYGQGPVGTLNANGVNASDNGQTIVFTGGVRVVIFYEAD